MRGAVDQRAWWMDERTSWTGPFSWFSHDRLLSSNKINVKRFMLWVSWYHPDRIATNGLTQRSLLWAQVIWYVGAPAAILLPIAVAIVEVRANLLMCVWGATSNKHRQVVKWMIYIGINVCAELIAQRKVVIKSQKQYEWIRRGDCHQVICRKLAAPCSMVLNQITCMLGEDLSSGEMVSWIWHNSVLRQVLVGGDLRCCMLWKLFARQSFLKVLLENSFGRLGWEMGSPRGRIITEQICPWVTIMPKLYFSRKALITANLQQLTIFKIAFGEKEGERRRN